MKLTVTVTAEHIQRGKRLDCARCPIALATRPLLVGCEEVEVFATHVEIRVAPGDLVHTQLPHEASLFVARFDGGLYVEPFTFEMAIPPELIRTETSAPSAPPRET